MKEERKMNMRKADSFSFFGKSFQDNLCQLILDDRPFCDQISEVLDISVKTVEAHITLAFKNIRGKIALEQI